MLLQKTKYTSSGPYLTCVPTARQFASEAQDRLPVFVQTLPCEVSNTNQWSTKCPVITVNSGKTRISPELMLKAVLFTHVFFHFLRRLRK